MTLAHWARSQIERDCLWRLKLRQFSFLRCFLRFIFSDKNLKHPLELLVANVLLVGELAWIPVSGFLLGGFYDHLAWLEKRGIVVLTRSLALGSVALHLDLHLNVVLVNFSLLFKLFHVLEQGLDASKNVCANFVET
jgi:hypothetical protein